MSTSHTFHRRAVLKVPLRGCRDSARLSLDLLVGIDEIQPLFLIKIIVEAEWYSMLCGWLAIQI